MSALSGPDGKNRHRIGPAKGGRPSSRVGLRRRSLSLRARLLAGLIALTTMFLVVMGVVTTVVLGTLERNQLNAEIKLASRQSVSGLAAGADGFAAAYLSLDSGTTGTLTPASPTADTLLAEVRSLAGLPWTQVYARLGKLAGFEQPFNLTISGAADGARRLARRSRPTPPRRPRTSCRRARPSSSSAARRAKRRAT